MDITLTGHHTHVHSLGVGVFDGLHLGHQELAKHCDALLSFSPHPSTIVKKMSIPRLTTPKELRTLFKSLILLKFTPHIASLDPIDFLNRVIKQKINPKKIVVGYDFKFGCQGKGTIDTLSKWCKENNIELTVISPLKNKQHIVKSSLIRQSIDTQQFNQAIELLGHPYLIIGKVIHGDHRGTSLGFPTANLRVPNTKLVPQFGVYAGFVQLNNVQKKAIIYIGSKPTYSLSKPAIEVHILDYSGTLYGNYIKTYLTSFIRPQQVFKNSNDLIDQIRKDITRVP